MFPLFGAKLCTDPTYVLSSQHPLFPCFFPSPSLPTSQHPVRAHSSVRRISDTFLLLAVQFFLLEAFSELHPLVPSLCTFSAQPLCTPAVSFPCILLVLRILFFFSHEFNSALRFLRHGPLLLNSAGTRPPPFFTQKCVVPFRTWPSLHFPRLPRRCSFHTVQSKPSLQSCVSPAWVPGLFSPGEGPWLRTVLIRNPQSL